MLKIDPIIVFFFSSRRRHTRLQGDWSSDVCSSDLGDNTNDNEDARWAHSYPGQKTALALRRKHQISGLRSEEHTSELQSPCNLVCRLLLEKKKITAITKCYSTRLPLPIQFIVLTVT